MNNWTFTELDRLIDGLKFMVHETDRPNCDQVALRYWASRAEAIKQNLLFVKSTLPPVRCATCGSTEGAEGLVHNPEWECMGCKTLRLSRANWPTDAELIAKRAFTDLRTMEVRYPVIHSIDIADLLDEPVQQPEAALIADTAKHAAGDYREMLDKATRLYHAAKANTGPIPSADWWAELVTAMYAIEPFLATENALGDTPEAPDYADEMATLSCPNFPTCVPTRCPITGLCTRHCVCGTCLPDMPESEATR